MAEIIGKIRELLGELEREWEVKAISKADLSFSALELAQIIQEIVDDLQPLLTPYDSVFYWFMFRHSICKSGEPYLRVSTRNLQGAVVKSARSDKADRLVSESKVQEILRDLELAGAIRKEGEPSRDGTPYRVFIPDDIEACRAFRAARLPKETQFSVAAADIDHYNIRENRLKVYERDSYICFYCQKQLSRFTATLDHVVPVVEGGGNDFENLVTACLTCNSRKHKRPVGDFLAEQ